MDKEFYVPTAQDLASQSVTNKQGRAQESLSPSESAKILNILKNDATTCYQNYMYMLNVDEDTQETIDPD
jgi:thymidylate synthase (FAD)